MPVGLLRDTIGGLIFTDVYMGTYYWSGSITTVRITLFERGRAFYVLFVVQ